jgi:hypothetical protein
LLISLEDGNQKDIFMIDDATLISLCTVPSTSFLIHDEATNKMAISPCSSLHVRRGFTAQDNAVENKNLKSMKQKVTLDELTIVFIYVGQKKASPNFTLFCRKRTSKDSEQKVHHIIYAVTPSELERLAADPCFRFIHHLV